MPWCIFYGGFPAGGTLGAIAEARPRPRPAINGITAVSKNPSPRKTKQICFRVDESISDRLEKIATDLGMGGVSTLIRMMIIEHIAEYQTRATSAHAQDKPD
jgi:hypothetical protein